MPKAFESWEELPYHCTMTISCKTYVLLMTTPLKALFIDLDGTLADTLDIMFGAYSSFLQHYGHHGSYEEFESLNGPSLPEVIAILQEHYHLQGPMEELIASIYKMTGARYMEASLFPGTEEFVKSMQHKGLRLAVVTSSPRRLAMALLEKHDLLPYFEAIVTSEGLEHSKPDPAIYRRALEKLQLPAESVLVIEDSSPGLAAAQNAGLATLHLCHAGRKSVARPSTNFVSHSWKETVHLIDELTALGIDATGS